MTDEALGQRPIIIVQARMSSTRLPGKVLRKVLQRPLLLYLIERLQRSSLARETIIATSVDSSDDPIVQLSEEHAISVVRGPLEDVLSRYQKAAALYEGDPIVRVCSDCVLIDPDVVDEAIRFYLQHKYDYVCNFFTRRYPRGYEVEVFSADTLSQASRKATQLDEREHVTPFIYRHPDLFSLGSVVGQKSLGSHRWVVDTAEDFALVSRIIQALYPDNPTFTVHDIEQLLMQHPNWLELNADIPQTHVKGMPGGTDGAGNS